MPDAEKPEEKITTLSNRESDIYRRVLRLSEKDLQTTQSLSSARLIGEGMMMVGLITIVVVHLLPAKPFKWIFYATGVILILAGGFRIDRATRSHRRLLKDKKKAQRILNSDRKRK